MAFERLVRRRTKRRRVPAPPADPPRRRLRYLAWSIALVLAVLAWFEHPSWPLRIAAAAVLAVGTVLPNTFRPLYRGLRFAFRPVASSQTINPVKSQEPKENR